MKENARVSRNEFPQIYILRKISIRVFTKNNSGSWNTKSVWQFGIWMVQTVRLGDLSNNQGTQSGLKGTKIYFKIYYTNTQFERYMQDELYLQYYRAQHIYNLDATHRFN